MIDLSDTRDWIAEHGLVCKDAGSLLAGIGSRLVERGLPVWRLYLGMPTISADIRALNVEWTRDRGIYAEGIGHGRDTIAFAESAFGHMVRDGVDQRRWRLAASDGHTQYAILRELRERGATDYVARVVLFQADEASGMKGAALSCATDRPEGFTDDEVAAIGALAPGLALAAYRVALTDVLGGVLSAYVGQEAGRRILRGEMRRGVGETLNGAFLFADLQGFTAVAETAGEGFIARLDEHLEAMAAPVEEAGGEILKFLGDGILAGFRLDGPADGESVLAAALEAIRRNALVNARHPGAPPLHLDVALHRGEVFYGNVGGGSRLDFTVIGPAVNEAARIEALCGTLGHHLLMSDSFAASCGRPTVSLGMYRLKGVAEPRELHALAE